MNRRIWLCVVAMIVLTGCTRESANTPAETPAPAAPVVAQPQGRIKREGCARKLAFGPIYLPDGFKPGFVKGPARGSRPTDGEDQIIFHLKGSGGRAIELRRPGTIFTELPLGDDAPTIEVLGENTPNFGPIEPGGGDFIVSFRYLTKSDSDDACASFSLNEVGIPLDELKKVAEGLRETH